MGDASSQERRIKHIQDAVLAFVDAQTWVESRSVARAQQENLLAPEADNFFAELLTHNKDNAPAVELLTQRHALLAQIKRAGIDSTYDDLITPRYVASLEQEMQNLAPGARRHIDVVRALLALTDSNNRSQLAHLQLKLGTTLARTGDAANFPDAIEVLQEALGNTSAEENPRLWGALQLTLADAIVQLAGRVELAGDSIEHYEAALQIWNDKEPSLARSIEDRIATLLKARANVAPDLNTRLNDLLRASELMRQEDAPEDWARLQHNLGETYRLLAADGEADASERAIEHLSKALEVFKAAEFPVDFGLAANSLGAAYLHRTEGDRSDNIEHALTHLNAALEVRPRDKYPDFWAKTQINLGGAYMTRIAGDGAENIEAAIRHLHAPLEGPASPWAEAIRGRIERQLADAYLKRTAGQRSDNLDSAFQHARTAVQLLAAEPAELVRAQYLIGLALHAKQPRTAGETDEAIKHIELALSVPTAFEHPLDRVQAEQAVAILYEYRETGEKSANQLQAIAHYDAARELYDGVGLAIGAATCHYWIGCVLRKRRDLSEHMRLTSAIERLRRAIDSYPPGAPASVRIDMHLEIGNVLIDLAAGDRGENIKTAIGHFEAALAELDDTDPRLSHAHGSLGVALLEWRGGDRAANLEQAIEHQRAVLAIVTREKEPELWARAHHNLGNVYSERTLGDRAQNIEDAIENFNAALEVFTQDDAPEDWAMTQNSLSNAYTVRARGDRAENLEQAITCYDKALEVYTEEAYPTDWAMTLHNLGTAYMKRIAGYEPENIERAINAFEKSLIYRTRKALPFFWAMTHANLGTAFAHRKYGERPENLREAVQHYCFALEVYTKEASPTNWAWVHYMLGSLSSTAGLSTDERIEHLTSALEEYRQHTHPERWALTHNSLALIYRERAQADPSARQQAIAHLQTALQAVSPEELPQQYRTVRINLADEYLRANDWHAALESYQHGIDVGETLLAAAYSEQGRLEESSAASRLYTHAAYCLLQLGEVAKSIVQLDAGRTRQLAESLARSHADLRRLPPPLRERLQNARQALDEIEATMRVRDEDLPSAPNVDLNQLQQLFPDAPSEQGPGYTLTSLTLNQARVALGAHGLRLNFTNGTREARQTLDAIVKEARANDANFMHAGIDAGDVTKLAPAGGALVTFILTPTGSAAVVIPHDAQSVDSSHTLALGSDAYDKVHELLNDWFNAYLDSREQLDLTLWQDTIESTTRTLWELVMAPVQERLQALGFGQDAPVCLMPQSTLALLPVHAAWREVDGRRRSFLDDHAVSYAPSLYALKTGQRQIGESARSHKRLLAVMNPTQDLPYAAVEGAAVASHFTPETTCALSWKDATETAVVAAVSGSNYLHFATHGQYDWRDVMRSHLLLAQGSRLTLARVMSTDFDLSAARLVVLSACETGLTEFQRAPDEFLGLPAGFMEGGAPGVVSALWAINDLSTALLFQEFYSRHLDVGQTAANALRASQTWLRDSTAQQLGLADHWQRIYETSSPRDGYAYRMMRYYRANPNATPYAAPYFWAAFTFNGA